MGMNRENIISTPQTRVNGLLKNVYLWMTAGLALTGVVAYGVSLNTELLARVYSSGALMAIFIAQLVLVFILAGRVNRMSTGAAIGCFIGYSVLTGLTMSGIFLVYTNVVISRASFTTALMFGGMSIYAMTTKKDLSRWSSIFVMALWGVIIASLINLLFKSEAIYYLVSIVGVILFAGITAWDTQKILRMNEEYGYGIDEATYVKLSILGALTLYLDFINIFLYLLRIFGSAKSNRN